VLTAQTCLRKQTVVTSKHSLFRPLHLLTPPRVRFDGTVTFGLTNLVFIPKAAGVYAVHDLRGILYVGRSIELRRRIWEHVMTEDNHLLRQAYATALPHLEVSWVLSGFPAQVSLERAYIQAFLPVCNRQLPASENN